MTAQEIFNKVVTHLRNQKIKSVGLNKGGIGENYICLYRGPNGTKCAVGCLIPDNVYQQKFEGHKVVYLATNYPEIEKLIHGNEILIAQLQGIHDYNRYEDWEDDFNILAKKCNLTVPEKI